MAWDVKICQIHDKLQIYISKFYRRIISGNATIMKNIFDVLAHDFASSDLCCYWAFFPEIVSHNRILNDFEDTFGNKPVQLVC